MRENKRIIVLVNVPQAHALRERAEKLLTPLTEDGYVVEYRFRDKSRLSTILNNIKTILAFKPSIIYAIDFGFSTVVPVLLTKIFLSYRFILDTGDITYELFKSTGRNRFVRLITWIIEPIVWKNADAIIVRGIYFEKYLRKKGLNNVYFVPDGVDTEIYKSYDVGGFRKSYGLENFITIGMVGSLNWVEKHNFCYGWELISSLRYLKDLPVKGLIVGDGTGLERLKKLAKEYEVDDKVLFLGRVSYKELPRYINLMDICLSTQSNDIVGNVRTTGKLPLYMACNRFILATKVGTAKYVLPKKMLLDYYGIRDDTYPERLAQRIRNLILEKKYMEEKIKLDEIARRMFDYQLLSLKIKNIIKTIEKYEDRTN